MYSKPTSEYTQTSIEDAIRALGTDQDGLTDSEAQVRIQKVGYNELVQKKRNPLLEFLSRYWGPMPWLLELVIALSYAIGRYLEAAIILGLLSVNAIIGFHHTQGSQKALDLLKKRLAVKAKVLRNRRWEVREARGLVPGDIIAVGLGDLIPADAKLISGDISVDQSALTGESLPVAVRQSGIVYSSSIVKRGEATAVVLNTGSNTYFGKTAELVKIARPKSHQEQIMMSIVKYMMYVSMAALVFVAADATLTHTSLLTIVKFALIFLMGAVPVALPAVFAVVLSVGAIELAKKGALVTRLDSIEDAASMDVLCLDKTGTITQNKLSVTQPIAFSRFKNEDVARMASLASREETKDVIDLTVIEYARTIGVSNNGYRQVSFTPFEPATKRSEAVVEHDGERFNVVKGAPQVILSLCRAIDDDAKNQVFANVERLSQKGYRTLAVATSDDKSSTGFKLVGLLPLADPARPDSKETIEQLKALGVKPKMLTGDNVAIAREIARQVHLGNRIYRMADLGNLDGKEQTKIIEEYDGLAEIYPEDKYKVVKLLQSEGHMVGMTGDGVNDAPALKQAEMGIAVSNATDVAKASASVVLTEPGTKVILDAIKTSRQIYQRMLTWVINKITKVIQVVALLTIGFFWTHELVLTLLGMALLIFANDFATMSISTDNVESAISPRTWSMKNMTLSSLVIGALFVVQSSLAIFAALYYFHLGMAQLQAMVTLNLIFNCQFAVLIVRERRHVWSSRPGRELQLTILGVLASFVVIGIFGFGLLAPLTPYEVFWILGYSAVLTVLIDIPKYYTFRAFGL